MIDLEEPDKGRAWLIAIAACIINMILSGLSRMVGILYVAIVDEYGVTRQEATVPFTVRNAIRCLSGPLVGIIAQKFGIRTITFFGGVIASTGAALCYVAPNILWLTVFWGGVHGFGFAMANTLFQVVVNQYFQKYRATASGIALSGACLGSFVFPVLIEWTLDTVGLSGGFLILAGIVLHVLPPSLLLSTPQWIEYPKSYARLWALKKSTTSSTVTVDTAEMVHKDLNKIRKEFFRSSSLDNCPADNMAVTSASRDILHKVTENGVVFKIIANEDLKKNNNKNAVICTRYKIQGSPKLERKVEPENGACHQISTISKSVQNDPNNLSEDLPAPSKSQSEKNQSQSIKHSLKSMAKLYSNPVYVLISVCMSTYILVFIPILTVLVDYGMDKGIAEVNGKYLINSMAIGDLIGRLGFGWVTDMRLMTVPSFMCLIFVLQGIFIVLFPFAMSLASFMALLVLYGMMAGAILVQFPVLVLKYVDINAQAVGMACVVFLSGIMSFAIPPMIGHFRDDVGSYDGIFYLTGIVSIASGGMWLLEPLVVKWYYDEKDMKAEQEANNHNTKLNQNN